MSETSAGRLRDHRAAARLRRGAVWGKPKFILVMIWKGVTPLRRDNRPQSADGSSFTQRGYAPERYVDEQQAASQSCGCTRNTSLHWLIGPTAPICQIEKHCLYATCKEKACKISAYEVTQPNHTPSSMGWGTDDPRFHPTQNFDLLQTPNRIERFPPQAMQPAHYRHGSEFICRAGRLFSFARSCSTASNT